MTAANSRTTPFLIPRRSQRILLSIPLEVSGTRPNGLKFVEDTKTLIVNSHGGLLLLKTVVSKGQILELRNLNTSDVLRCTVSEISEGQNGTSEVGIQFVAESSRFWRVSFPPVNWSSRSSEAKRSGNSPLAIESTVPSNEKK